MTMLPGTPTLTLTLILIVVVASVVVYMYHHIADADAREQLRERLGEDAEWLETATGHYAWHADHLERQEAERLIQQCEQLVEDFKAAGGREVNHD